MGNFEATITQDSECISALQDRYLSQHGDDGSMLGFVFKVVTFFYGFYHSKSPWTKHHLG